MPRIINLRLRPNLGRIIAGSFAALALAAATLIFLAIPSPAPAKSADRTHLLPHFVAGQVFRYSVQTKLETASQSSGMIVNAEGAQKFAQSLGMVIRLQVLSASENPAGPSARIRITYENVAVTSSGAKYDPDVAAMQKRYQQLAGKSFEFTLEPGGRIGGVTGLKNALADPSRAAIVNEWLAQLTLGASLPRAGIAVGEKWASEQPLENMPLTGLVWKTRASYLRNEPCPAAARAPVSGRGQLLLLAPSAENACAVILTHAVIVGGKKFKDRTPPVFRQNGLRTYGVWMGSAEALVAISLRTGMVASVTETGSTRMDFTIMTVAASNRMRYAGSTRTQSQITLLSQSAVP